jgi:hypothetical protein
VFVFVAVALDLEVAVALPVPLVLVVLLVHEVLVLPPDVTVVHAANALVGLNDSMAVIRARDMLKDNVITAVRLKFIT